MIRILLVDDHELVRTGVEFLLNAQQNLSVVGVVGSGEEALVATQNLNPDVVLMDINMPGIGGVEASKRLLQRFPDIKIIVLSVHSDGPLPQQLMKMGAKGFLCKDSGVEEMVSAINDVVHGKRFICQEVINHLAFSTLGTGEDLSPFEKLTPRELAVVTMVVDGCSIREIAKVLSITEKTVNTYRYRLHDKLQVKNDVELTRMAIKYEFIDP